MNTTQTTEQPATGPTQPVVVRHEEHATLSIYVTRNRRCPVLGLYGRWPARSAFGKMAKAGVKLAVRETTKEERDGLAGTIRYMGIKWNSLRGMLRDERDYIDDGWFQRLLLALRAKKSNVAECFKEVSVKKRKHQQELFEKRAARQPAGFAV